MDEDIKSNKVEGFCEECGAKLCSNCGKCCKCGTCNCNVCHPEEKDNEPEGNEPVNYP